jgi:hypothetical protein
VTGARPGDGHAPVGGERVVVLVTEGCHLCADACSVVQTVCDELGVTWAARDLAALDDEVRVRWREFVPVVMVDGKVREIFRVDADRFRAALLG